MKLPKKFLIKNFPHAITICSVGEILNKGLVRQFHFYHLAYLQHNVTMTP